MLFTVFDIETAGLELHHPVIQFAAVALEDFEEVESIEVKIQFDIAKADPEALKLNSFDPKVWGDEALPEFLAVANVADFLIRNAHHEMKSKRTGRQYWVARLAGHNAAGFDGPRLQAMFKRHGAFLPAHPQILDTLQLALWKSRAALDSYKLSDLCKTFGIDSTGAHDALADVRMCAKLASYLMKENSGANR